MNNVIHVAFGKDGGRIPDAPEPPPAAEPSPKAPAFVAERYPVAEVTRLTGLSPARLRAIDQAHLLGVGVADDGTWSFADVVALRSVKSLLGRVSIGALARAVEQARGMYPRVLCPLRTLKFEVVGRARRIVFRAEGAAFDAGSGQGVLTFDASSGATPIAIGGSSVTRERAAYDLYAAASKIDEDRETFEEAEALYRRAMALDPKLAIAYTNLGNIRFRRGDEAEAEALYRQALDIDAQLPEAHYNLGYVLLERGQTRASVPCFQRALEADPRFADAQFNLAMAYEQLGERAKSWPHWKRYLEIEPTGTWAEIARQHLRVVPTPRKSGRR